MAYKYWERLREKNPEKYKEMRKKQNRKYLEKKFNQQLKENKIEMINKIEKTMKPLLNKLTRILYDDLIEKECAYCGSKEDLQIHHKKYTYPINKEDLIRLCRKCHIEEHQKLS